jgi:ornithine carbamoyltransferase
MISNQERGTHMAIRHFLSIADLHQSELMHLIRRSLAIKNGCVDDPLRKKIVGIHFQKTSTRTRSSFTVGALKLGANTVVYAPGDLQTNTGESIEDTARVLAGYLDALVIRTAGNIAEMRALANQNSMAVINAMSEWEHPTQAVADLCSIEEHFGQLGELHILYLGEGNNTATALALACGHIPGIRLSLFTPEGYGLPSEFVQQAAEFGSRSGAIVEEFHDPDRLPSNVDVVYTTRWQTTGSSKPDPNWRAAFLPYSVTSDLMLRVSRRAGTIFMHDLPAVRGEDVAADVLDGPLSIAFLQATNKLYSAMAILEWCVTPYDLIEVLSSAEETEVAQLNFR